MGSPFAYSIPHCPISTLSKAFDKANNTHPLFPLTKFLFVCQTMSIVDFFILYPRCVSSVRIFIRCFNVFGITVAHILYILLRSVICLQFFIVLCHPVLCISVITPCFRPSGISCVLKYWASSLMGLTHIDTFCLKNSVGMLSFPVALLSLLR